MSKSLLYRLAGGAAGVALGLMAVFCALISYQTLAELEPPLTFDNGTAIAWPVSGETVISYTRSSRANYSAQSDLMRVVTCDVGGSTQSFDLPAVFREYKAGEAREIVRIVHYPAELPIGTECVMETYVKWSPTFSMSWHLAKMSDIRFTVSTKGRR